MSDEDVLAHFGVKGMHWGVYKQRELDRHIRVASGKGSFNDKRLTLGEMSPLGLARLHGSIQKYSAERAVTLEAQKARIQSGKGTALDLVDTVSHLSVAELIKSRHE